MASKKKPGRSSKVKCGWCERYMFRRKIDGGAVLICRQHDHTTTTVIHD